MLTGRIKCFAVLRCWCWRGRELLMLFFLCPIRNWIAMLVLCAGSIHCFPMSRNLLSTTNTTTTTWWLVVGDLLLLQICAISAGRSNRPPNGPFAIVTSQPFWDVRHSYAFIPPRGSERWWRTSSMAKEFRILLFASQLNWIEIDDRKERSKRERDRKGMKNANKN